MVKGPQGFDFFFLREGSEMGREEAIFSGGIESLTKGGQTVGGGLT